MESFPLIQSGLEILYQKLMKYMEETLVHPGNDYLLLNMVLNNNFKVLQNIGHIKLK